MGPQRQALQPAVHSGMAPIEHLACGVVQMAGGHHAAAHIHAESEITVYVHSGMVASLVGDEMTPVLHSPGSIVYIAAGIPHIGVNLHPASTAPAVQGWRGSIRRLTAGRITLKPGAREAAGRVARLFEARTDRTFNGDVIRRPDLDALVAVRVEQVQRDFALGLFAEKLATPTVHAVTWEPV